MNLKYEVPHRPARRADQRANPYVKTKSKRRTGEPADENWWKPIDQVRHTLSCFQTEKTEVDKDTDE